jgi:nicotinamide riboside kinase
MEGMTQSTQYQQRPSNIYVVGAQSSGKTTLVSGLEKYFHVHSNINWGALVVGKPLVLEEVAGQVLMNSGYTGKTVSESKSQALQLQTLILETQYEAEDAIKDFWFISDRSGVDAIVYAKLYAGESEVEQLLGTKKWKEMESALQNSLIIVCEPVLSWLKEDGLRFMPKDRSARIELVSKIHRLFCDILNSLGLKYVILPKGVTELDARVRFVIAKWKEMGDIPK